MRKGKILSSNNFYDSIAAEYNSHMTGADARIRHIVKSALTEKVASGNILDFGGGTGMDMEWLTAIPAYKVYFLEPSKKMRTEAKIAAASLKLSPQFIEDNIDFNQWTADRLPMREKMTGILANFAVLNCIQDITLLFEKLALISAPGCYLFATVIDSRPEALRKHYRFNIVLRAMLNIKAVVYSNYQNTGHKTYLHTIRHYNKAAGKYFRVVSFTPLELSNMALLILSRR